MKIGQRDANLLRKLMEFPLGISHQKVVIRVYHTLDLKNVVVAVW